MRADLLAPRHRASRYRLSDAHVGTPAPSATQHPAWRSLHHPPLPPQAVLNQYQYNFLSLELQTRMKAAGARKSVPFFAHPDAPSQNGVSTFVNYR